MSQFQTLKYSARLTAVSKRVKGWDNNSTGQELAVQCEVLSLIPSTHVKRGVVLPPISVLGSRDGRIPGVHWPTSIA